MKDRPLQKLEEPPLTHEKGESPYPIEAASIERKRLKRFLVCLEDEQLEGLAKAATELGMRQGVKWSTGAVIRLAIDEYLGMKKKTP